MYLEAINKKFLFNVKWLDNTEHQLTHAVSPQVEIFDNIARIYYCARRRVGCFQQSVPLSVDYTIDFESIIEIRNDPILNEADLGTFDEHGIFPFSPFKIKDQVVAYTTGWSRRQSVSVETGIGLVKSDDGGLIFERMGVGPIITASRNEPFLVCDAFVKNFKGQYYMWYLYGTNWIELPDGAPERVYKIGQRVANNIEFKNCEIFRNIIADELPNNECQALPSVEFFNGRYHMVFAFRDAIGFRDDPQKAYRLGYAYSDDLVSWKRDDTLLKLGDDQEWDDDMKAYPNLKKIGSKLFLFYNGNNFGSHGFGMVELKCYD